MGRIAMTASYEGSGQTSSKQASEGVLKTWIRGGFGDGNGRPAQTFRLAARAGQRGGPLRRLGAGSE